MKALINAVTLVALLWAASPATSAQEVVRVEASPAFDADTLATLQQLAEGALRRHGVSGRTFTLRVGRLGDKIPMSLEETAADGSVSRAESLAAMRLEEADTVISRLVEAVASRKNVASTARIQTVVEAEAQEPIKLPSENHWSIGVPVLPGGFYSSYSRQTPNWRIDVVLQGTGKWGESGSGAGFFGVGAARFFSDGPSAPFIGGGAGMVWVDEREGTGFKLEAGMELLRLHKMRLIVVADVIVPTFDPREGNQFSDAKRVYPSLQLRVGF